MANETEQFQITREAADAGVDLLKKIMVQGPYGHMDQVYTNAFFGLNHRKAPTALPRNREQTPLIFITRPRLNLSSDNLRADRKFNSLAIGNRYSLARAIRCLLDPRLAPKGEITSPFVDNRQAFIPIFMETAQAVSGWQDIAAQTYNSPDGKMQESYGWIDGPIDIYRSFDIDMTMRNMDGNVSIYMLAMWIIYQAYVFAGIMVPYPPYVLARRRDFDSRIYSIVLKSDGYSLSQIMCTGASHPVAVSSAAAHNFEFGKTINTANDLVTCRFKCYGQLHYDDIVIDQFNRAVRMTNGDMMDGYRENAMVKIPRDELFIYNHNGYPYINIDTAELEWWIPRDKYLEVAQYISGARINVHNEVSSANTN